jgi:hypothetical protein
LSRNANTLPDEVERLTEGAPEPKEELLNPDNFAPEIRNGGWKYNVLQYTGIDGKTRNNLQRSFVIMNTRAKNGYIC